MVIGGVQLSLLGVLGSCSAAETVSTSSVTEILESSTHFINFTCMQDHAKIPLFEIFYHHSTKQDSSKLIFKMKNWNIFSQMATSQFSSFFKIK